MTPETPGTPKQVGLEIREGRPWWKVCCVGCFALFVIAIVLLTTAWRGWNGGGPHTVAELPTNFPANVAVYRIKDAKTIVYLPGKEKDRLVAMLLSPFKFFGNIMVTDRQAGSDGGQWYDRITEGSVSQLQKVDTVTITWERLKAERGDVEQWYYGELQRNGFGVKSSSNPATATDVIVAQRNDTRVQIQLQDQPDIPDIDSVVMIVDYLNQ